MCGKRRIVFIGMMISCLLFGGVPQVLYGQSLYAITNHGTSTITAYDIEGAGLEYQTDIAVPWGTGSVGLALDPESETLFVTYDGPEVMELINAKTMEEIDYVSTTDELAGIVFDTIKRKLYGLSREDTKLYPYLWDPSAKSLVLIGGTYKELWNLSKPPGGFGLALDEDSGRLFVTDATNAVKYYDTGDPDFGYLGSIPIVVGSNQRQAVGIAFYEDGEGNKYLYTGGYDHEGLNNVLVQTDISEIDTPICVEQNIGTSVIGVHVDEATGLVYVTTTNDRIMVFDHGSFPSDPCYTETANISGPADIIVRGDVSYRAPRLTIAKVHDVSGCLMPGEAITYTISYDANGWADSNVVLTDYLPIEAHFNTASDGGSYDFAEHTVRWEMGELEVDESGSVTLNVIVNERADLNRSIINRCEIEGDTYCSRVGEVDASACCRPLDIIYVSEKAAGYDTGVSWLHAYNQLESALNRARTCGGSEVWVAGGTYSPAEDQGTFSLVDGVGLYGGFGGYESTLEQRGRVKKETVLSGDSDGDETPDVDDVVTASNLSNGVIDGFTIRDGGDAGIKCESSGLAVINCRLTGNFYGIEGAEESSLTVRNSMIRENYYEGIMFWERDAADEVVVENTCILGNGGAGIYCAYETGTAPVIRNSSILSNGPYGGINVLTPAAQVTSCVVWGNAWDQLWSCTATYSCIEGGWDGTGNIDLDPLFIDEPEEAYDYHLSESSPCKDGGDENYTPSDPEETDIDGEARVTGGRVDMGADEYYRSAADFDGDEVVNFLDHAVFASAWLSSAGEGGYNESCDLVEDETIDYSDFAVFCEDWLWEAGWTKSFGEGRGESMAMGGDSGGEIVLSAPEQVEAEQVKEVDIEELLKLLGEVWLDEEVRKVIGEDEWAAFVEAVKAALLQDG